MNTVEFRFDDTPHYALYELIHLDGVEQYYLELRDRSLITEFGLELRFRLSPDGRLSPGDAGDQRKKDLLETILVSIQQKTKT